MTGPLGCLFAFVFAVLAVVLFFLLSIIRKAKEVMSAFSGKKKRPDGAAGNARAGKAGNGRPHPHHPHRKIFDDNEGEYVDFEEIKDR